MKSTKLLLFCLLFMLCGSQIHAVDSVELKEKSPEKAVMWSAAGTIFTSALSIPFMSNNSEKNFYSNGNEIISEESDSKEIIGIGLLASGILIGPGIGHLYANNKKAFFKGIVIRTIGGGAMLYGADNVNLFSKDKNGAGFLMVAGGIVLLVSMISDIANADNSVRAYNKTNSFTQLNLYPSFKANEMRMNFAWSF